MIRWVALGLVAVAGAAAAQTAYFGARAAGQVGERYDGYLGYSVAQPNAPARTQTETINIRRRALYSDLAQRRGVSPQEVGITAGCTLLARVAVGESYMLADGQWRRRVAGEPAPVPDYCKN
ncbi:YdbL family protein [Sphingomonas sp. LHG3406-1]|uniref:YdbL family protein n=1 Tax=Sphingomonas sp. LHG3406-1 TaxID=2804617 RepID=UPI0026046852|nr:YdbL family protein [Sphingomonas sp. LHG3406-1]